MLSTYFQVYLGWLMLSMVHRATGYDIQSYLAMGDSYPAGDGAGHAKYGPGYSIKCGQYSDGYPVIIAERLGVPSGWYGSRTFNNKACGGATTATVRWHQIWFLEHNSYDLATVQIGGNEVDFFPILNECIQQWHPLSTCDRELARAKSLIQSKSFKDRFDKMMSAAKYLKQRGWLPDTHLLVLGYAKFFNEATVQCNKVSFSYTNPTSVLSQELRHDLNQLVVMLNDVIRISAIEHNATYVDIDEVFEGHRFCEKGVIEPHPDWTGTWFFREVSRQAQDHASELVLKRKHQAQLTTGAEGNMHSATVMNGLGRFAELTRTFHPTTEGHHAIADKVLEVLAKLMESQQQAFHTEI